MTTISLTVWDVPRPVVAGQNFAVKIGASGALPGARVEVTDAGGAVVASGALGSDVWPGSERLRWCSLEVPAPRDREVADYAVRLAGGDAVPTRFSVTVAGKPAYTLTVSVTERDSGEPLDGVEVRVGPFGARTGKDGRAEVRVSRGDFQLRLWRTAHLAEPQPVRIGTDLSLDLTMIHVPEEHPDARWVR